MGENTPKKQGLAVGDFKIWKLQDAQISLKLSLLKGIDLSEAQKLNGGKESQATPVNVFLVKTPEHVILVDTGTGKNAGENSGHLPGQLKSIGTDPSEVDLILLTHLHFDHIGGLTSTDGKRLFPKATIRLSKVESDFWLRDPALIPADMRERAKSIKAILEPYIQAKAYQPFSGNEDLAQGVKAQEAFGHTVGHTIYIFSSKGKEFRAIGDLIHFGGIQFSHPKVSVAFDTNSDQAVASRLLFFNQAANNQAIIGGAHLFNMLRLKKSGGSFVATPVP